jgi:Protein of unknown function (DUF1569)
MQRSLSDARARQELVERLERLAPEAKPLWGNVQSFETLNPAVWPEHPVFGEMTPRAWCVLGYRHMDHHLRQFGI